VFVPRDPAACWQAFTDARHLATWVPGLRRADILTKARGYASEVHFEWANARAYTLEYSYDAEKREVTWRPKLGAANGVTGFARFDAVPGGTRVTYGLQHGAARTPDEQALGSLDALVIAFAKWLER